MQIFIIFLIYLLFNDYHCDGAPTTSPTTTTSEIVLFSSSPTGSPGNLGNRATTNAICTARAISLGLNVEIAKSLLSYTGDPVSGLPASMGFSPTSPVKGPTGTTIAPTWSSAFAGPTTTLTNSLATAGVPASSPTNAIWTGTSNVGATGSPSAFQVCSEWSTTSANGIVGGTTVTTSGWILNGNAGCSFSLNFVCVGKLATSSPTTSPTTLSPTTKSPTLSPTTLSPTTKSPTNSPTIPTIPTNDPTKNPTKSPTLPTKSPTNPTKIPTVSPTKNPTKSPTLPTKSPTNPTKIPTVSPTKNPTLPTKSPTRNPTVPTKSPTTGFPTKNPTLPPTMLTTTRFMYKLLRGTTVDIQKNYNNISFSHDNSSPTNITIQSIGNVFTAVGWSSLRYRVYNPNNGTTTTVILSGIHSPCNPGQPSPIPGTPYIQLDGYYSCPTVEKCTLTSDCTDSLAPVSGAFPDLRACYCSFTETLYPNIPPLPANEYLTLSLWSGKMNVTSPIIQPSNVLGQVQCNSFIDRTINCQLTRQDPRYPFQCVDQPIGCYDYTLGEFFGGFYNQNPKFIYGGSSVEWTRQHYVGIGSIMNGKMFSKGGRYVDPFTSTLLNAYYWIESNAPFNLVTLRVYPNFTSYQTYVIQGDPFIYQLSSQPPPVVNFALSRLPSADELACVPVTPSTCTGITWKNQTGPNYRLAGLEWSVLLPNDTSPITVTLVLSVVSPSIKGIEVYSPWGELCGSVYADGLTDIDSTWSFLCVNTPSSGKTHTNSTITVRILGQESIYDIPNANLNSDYLLTPPDSLTLPPSLYTPYLFNTWPLMFSQFYDVGQITNPRTWPQRQRLDLDLTTTFPFIMTVNYTSSTGGVSPSAWANISASILINNTYPENIPLLFEYHKYTVSNIDYDSPSDRKFLEEVWEVHLAPRFCGADETQCKTFQLGKCIVTSNRTERWLNGDRNADYDAVGIEGGCNCFKTFSKGFFNFQLFCQHCEIGYGPNTLSALSDTIQYNALVSPLYANGVLPSSSISLQEFNSDYICRFPYGIDPLAGALVSINMCAGHGIMSYNSTNTTIELTVWDGNVVIACSSIAATNQTYILSDQITSAYNLIYIDEDSTDILSIIGTLTTSQEIYLNDEICVLLDCSTNTFPIPWTCLLVCPSITKSITCINPLLFTTNDISIGDYRYTMNIFLISRY